MKLLRRFLALFTLATLASKGALSFLRWFENHDNEEMVWSDEEEFEEVM